MTSLLVLIPFLITTALLALIVRLAWPTEVGTAGGIIDKPAPASLEWAVILLAALTIAVVVCFAAPLYGPPLQVVHSSDFLLDSYQRYRACLCESSFKIQGLVGLAFAVGLGLATGLLFLAQSPRRWWFAAGCAILVWACLYGLLPFHLSAPDYDDIFVVDKFLCSLGRTWVNDKPDFTLFDYLYRVGDLWFPSSERFLRFGINGWLLVLYELNLLMVMRRFLAEPARRALGPTMAAFGAALAMGNVGLLLLSHTLAYELAGSTCLWTAFNLIEHLRAAPTLPRSRALAILALCSLGIWLQAASIPEFNGVWTVVCCHAVLTLLQSRVRRVHTLLAAALAGASLWAFLVQQRIAILSTLQPSRWGATSLSALAALALASLGAAVWLFRRAPGVCRSPEPGRALSSRLVLCLYGAGTLGLALFPNQLHFLPEPYWIFAENHARYTSICYPIIVLAAGWLACRLKTNRLLAVAASLLALAAAWVCAYHILAIRFEHARPLLACVIFFDHGHRLLFLFLIVGWLAYTLWAAHPLAVTAVLMALACAFWNGPYLADFYMHSPPPHGIDEETDSPYQRNMRPLLALDQALLGVPDVPLCYLPIPRDHGDHYLAKAVRPAARVSSVCSTGWRPDAAGRLVLSRHTGSVGMEALGLRLPLRGPFRDMSDRGWEVQVFADSELDPAAVTSWCRALAEARRRPSWCRAINDAWRCPGSAKEPLPAELPDL